MHATLRMPTPGAVGTGQTWKPWVLAWLVALLAVVLVGCPKGGADAEVVTVGAYFSLSGSDSTFGIDSREGIEMATEEVNQAGGVKGKPVRVLFEDDKSSVQEESNKVLQLIDRDKVIALLG